MRTSCSELHQFERAEHSKRNLSNTSLAQCPASMYILDHTKLLMQAVAFHVVGLVKSLVPSTHFLTQSD